MNLDTLRAAVFREDYPEKTKAILTQWSDRRKTPEQLQWAANTAGALAEYLREDFGQWRTQIRRRFRFKVADITSAGGALSFPGGTLTYAFAAGSRDRGSITRELSVDASWFADGAKLAALLEIFGFKNSTFELQLNADLDPLAKVDRLEAAGWEIERESESEVVAEKSGLKMTIRPPGIEFGGVNVQALLAAGEGNEISLALDAV